MNINRSSFERTIWDPLRVGFVRSGWRFHRRGIAQFHYDHYYTLEGRTSKKWWIKIWLIDRGVQYSEQLEMNGNMNRHNVIRAVCSWLNGIPNDID